MRSFFLSSVQKVAVSVQIARSIAASVLKSRVDAQSIKLVQHPFFGFLTGRGNTQVEVQLAGNICQSPLWGLQCTDWTTNGHILLMCSTGGMLICGKPACLTIKGQMSIRCS